MRSCAIGSCLAALAAGFIFTLTAAADTPAFDRPGISFSTGTLPPGTFAWEQGLPDFAYDSGSGTRSWLFSADANLRIGLLQNLEAQIGVAAWNYQETSSKGSRRTDSGLGDTSLSLKAAFPSFGKLSWAVLGGVTLPSGDDAFTADDPQYDLGVTFAYQFNDTISAAAYVNFNRFEGDTTWTFSPSVSRAISDRWAVYLEAGWDVAEGTRTSTVAGGGITCMLTKTVQLDFSLDAGISGDAPDLTGGFGISVFFD